MLLPNCIVITFILASLTFTATITSTKTTAPTTIGTFFLFKVKRATEGKYYHLAPFS